MKKSNQPKVNRPVTMRMVAAAAKVSTVTVSLSLRNHPSIPESTRSRIKNLAKKMGYRANPLVSALMAQLHTRRSSAESPVLSLILEEGYSQIYTAVPYYLNLFQGARDRASQLGYHLESTYLKMEKSAGTRMHRNLHARNVRGVIIAPIFQACDEYPLPFDGLACCALGYSLHKPDIHRAVPNYAQTMRLTWTKFLEKGYRRPGFISTFDHLERTHFERLGAFAAQQGCHPEIAQIPPLILKKSLADYPREGLEELLDWFHRYRPDVFLFPPWAMLAGIRKHLEIPKDVGIILTDIEAGWTQVQEGAYLVGSAAVDMVVAQIHRNETGIPVHPKTMAINSVWVDGFSLPQLKNTKPSLHRKSA